MSHNNLSLLVGNEHIPIILYYTSKKNKHGIAKVKIIDEKEYNSKTQEEKNKISILNTIWRIINFKTSQAITSECIFTNPDTGEREINFQKMQELTIKAGLFEWDMVDDNGNTIPLVPNNIDATHPDIIYSLYNKYQGMISDDSDDEKKV